MAITSNSFLTKGSQVEVSSHEAGSNDAWYSATVINAPPSTTSPKHTSSNSLVYVEYRNLLSEDGSSNRLREYANIAHVRPAPVSDTGPIDFQLNDLVDAFYRDGWWTGVITTVVDASNFSVTFQNSLDEVQFRCKDLRIHKEWIGGRWFQPQKQDDMALRTTNNQTKQATPITAKESPVATSIMKRKRQDLDNNDKASSNDEIMKVDSSEKKKHLSDGQSKGFDSEVNGTTENFSHEKKVMAKKDKLEGKKKEKAHKESDAKHNICITLDEKASKAEYFTMIFPFIKRSCIFYAATTHCTPYSSIIKSFWSNATIHCENKVTEIHSEVQEKKVIITEELIRKVLKFDDKADYPRAIDERLVKGCFQRMGYAGAINATRYQKANFPRPYKLLIHVMLHVFGHRKGGYDDVNDYMMCAITALCLNLPYNFSYMVFKNMKNNITGANWLLYPRFVQMMIDAQLKNLKKDKKDVFKMAHMTTGTYEKLASYRGQGDDYPRFRRLFGHLINENYIAPENNQWRHDDSDSDSDSEREAENKRMELYRPVDRFIKIEIVDSDDEDVPKPKKRKRTPKVRVETLEASIESESDDQGKDGDDEVSESDSTDTEKYVVKPRVVNASPSSQHVGQSSLELDFDLFGDEQNKKDIAELKQIVADQNVKIGSLMAEVDHLRSESVAQKTGLKESEYRGYMQADLLNQFIKYFKVIESKLGISLARESEDVMFDQVTATNEYRLFKELYDLDVAEMFKQKVADQVAKEKKTLK